MRSWWLPKRPRRHRCGQAHPVLLLCDVLHHFTALPTRTLSPEAEPVEPWAKIKLFPCKAAALGIALQRQGANTGSDVVGKNATSSLESMGTLQLFIGHDTIGQSR